MNQLKVLLLSALPILELRGAIPIARTEFGLSVQTAYLCAVIGNLIPVIPLLLFLGPVSDWLRKFPVGDRFFTWLFARTRRRGRRVEKYEFWGLISFVAIPLPVTGAWTGCVAAFIFGIRFWKALLSIAIGVLLAGVIVTLACEGIIKFAMFVKL